MQFLRYRRIKKFIVELVRFANGETTPPRIAPFVKLYGYENARLILFKICSAILWANDPTFARWAAGLRIKHELVVGEFQTVPWQLVLRDAISDVPGLSEIVKQDGSDFEVLPNVGPRFAKEMAKIVRSIDTPPVFGHPYREEKS